MVFCQFFIITKKANYCMEKPEISRSLDPSVPPFEASMRQPFADTVFMCSKCCRKLGDDGKALRKRLKNAIHTAFGADVVLEKTDCFSLCPKGGQVLSTSSKQQGRRLVIIEPNSDIDRALDYLLKR